MSHRIDYKQVAPKVFDALLSAQKQVNAGSLEPALVELVKIRASQINGCVYCLDMHCTEARKAGEDSRRLDTLAAWRESPFFTPRERAALAWTEALTRLPEAGVSDALYAEVSQHFEPVQLAELTLVVTVINSWNRFGVAFAPALP
ncbi:MAG TPA: carboxymuconolactone decarboxylase family protein [Rhodanobacteraceae bacterium]|nr:carboxymuconolactone decarboxylase family protein [Rhodanobacteraceae bacterium]